MVTAQPDDVLERDELWTFVRRRQRGVVWLWVALCRRTRQIVAYALGPRNDATARLLWARIPPAYRQGLLYTDHLESYHNLLPASQHQARYRPESAVDRRLWRVSRAQTRRSSRSQSDLGRDAEGQSVCHRVGGRTCCVCR